MASVRIVAFLGRFKEQESPAYEFIWRGAPVRAAAAPIHVGIWTEVARRLGDEHPALMLLGTSRARKDWITNGRFMDWLGKATGGAEIGPVWFREYEIAGAGENDTWKQSWDLFDALRGALASDALDPASLEQVGEHWERRDEGQGNGLVPRASTVLFDVTRGFRASPILGCSALSLVLADERRRRRDAQAPETRYHLLYAAAEENEALAPIWDLSAFVEATDLSAGLDALERYCHGDGLVDMLRGSGNESCKAMAESLARVAGDLARMGIPQLLGRDAEVFRDTWAAHRDAVDLHIPFLAKRLDDFGQRLESLTDRQGSVKPISREGVTAALRLADWLLEADQVLAAAGVLRETAVTAFSVASRAATLPSQPGDTSFLHERFAFEQAMNTLAAESFATKTREPRPPLEGLVRVFRGVGGLRNDLLHGGYSSAIDRTVVKDRALALAAKLKERVALCLHAAPAAVAPVA